MNDNTCLVVDECSRTPYDEMLPTLLMEAPGLPSDTAAFYLRQAAISFCKRSKVLRQDLYVPIQACVANPIIEPLCDDLQIVSLHNVCGREVIASTPCRCEWGATVQFLPPNQLELYPAPASTDSDRTLQVTVSLAPKRDACEIPTVLYERYAEVIEAGAMARILRIPEFKDLRLAERYARDFEGGISAAGIDRLLGYSMGPISMRSRHHRIV